MRTLHTIVLLPRDVHVLDKITSGHVLKEESSGRLLGAAVMLIGAVMIALARG